VKFMIKIIEKTIIIIISLDGSLLPRVNFTAWGRGLIRVDLALNGGGDTAHCFNWTRRVISKMALQEDENNAVLGSKIENRFFIILCLGPRFWSAYGFVVYCDLLVLN